MMGNSSGRTAQFTGEFSIVKEVYNAMQETAASAPRKEIGGMLFGSIDDEGDVPNVRVEQVVHLPPEGYSHSSTHFEIDPKYSNHVVDKYSSKRKYLGNWHSHLGYGGPSSGDHQQVTDFFHSNDFREYLVSIIMDREKKVRSASYQPIVEIYRNRGSGSYDTWRVDQNDLLLIGDSGSEDAVEQVGTITESSAELDSGDESLEAQIEDLDLENDLQTSIIELVDLMSLRIDLESDLSKGLAYVYEGSGSVDTAVVALPVKYRLQQDPDNIADFIVDFWENLTGESEIVFPAYVTVSVPYSCPEGDIYIDLATRDLTKQLTIKTIESSTLINDKEMLLNTLEYAVESHIPKLLRAPLISVLQDELEWSQ